MESCQKRLGLSFVACMATLGFIMFVTDDQRPFDDNQNTVMVAAPIPETTEVNDDGETPELSFVQTSSAWMWDRSDKARKRMGLGPKNAFKPNPVSRAQRIKKIAALIIREANSRTKSKMGLMSVSVRSAGMSKFQHTSTHSKDPFTALMHTAALNAVETKWRNAMASRFVKRAVKDMATRMIKRARSLKTPQAALSQWMWDSPKSKAKKEAQKRLAHVKRLGGYDQRRVERHLNRIAKKVADEAELEQKSVLVRGSEEAKQEAVMKIAMVNTWSFLREAKATCVRQLKEFLNKMSEAMINHIALAKHANKVRKEKQAGATRIKHAIIKRQAKIAFVKKAMRTAKGRGKKTLQKVLAIHQKKLAQLKRSHKAQMRKVSQAADFLHKTKRDFSRGVPKPKRKHVAKRASHTSGASRKASRKSRKASRKARKIIAAAISGKRPGDDWGAKKKASRRADCLQEGAAIDCATERIKH